MAKKITFSRSAIQKVIKKHRETGSVKDRAGRERKKITTPRDAHLIKQSLKNKLSI